MIFGETALAGAFVIDIAPRQDSRGFFARAYCHRDFVERGLNPVVVQTNIAFNHRRGTLRGLHFQFPPAAEAKLVRCTRGAIHDVIVDLRPESPTYLRHVSAELTAENRRSLFVPERFAHGYQVLEDDTEVTYQVSEMYAPEAEGGLPYDDPRLAIAWPLPVTEISDKDRRWAALAEVEAAVRGRMVAAAGAPATSSRSRA